MLREAATRQTDGQSFSGRNLRNTLGRSWSSPRFSEGERRKHIGRTPIGMSQRAHPRPPALRRNPYILISAVQVNFTLGSGRSLFNFAASNSRIQNLVM